MSVRTAEWSPTSWREFPIQQLPDYPNKEELERCYAELQTLPPLVTSWEIESLKDKLAAVSKGNAFLFQAGDCAESFDLTRSSKIVNLVKVLLQTSFIMIHEMGVPVIRVGRMAGQYAKPRSSAFETVDGVEMHNYRGDLINGFEKEQAKRVPDPKRLLEGYHKAGLTLNFIRALGDEGFADLHYPEQWELDFMQNNPYHQEYESMVKSITQAVKFMDAVSERRLQQSQKVDFYTSHEALNLFYDSAQTRKVPRKEGYFNLSAHMVWLGNRTRDLDEAHVEYLRGIENPIGIKIGPPYTIDATLKLIEKLNPTHEAGKIVLITRFGKDQIQEGLPGLIQAVRGEGFPVVWSSDPMHGNTFSSTNDYKTRNFDHIMEELKHAFAIHRSEGSYLGSVHLELTGDDVTECVGGAKGLDENGLNVNYETFCDPRLNYEQSLELAFLISKEWKKSYG